MYRNFVWINLFRFPLSSYNPHSAFDFSFFLCTPGFLLLLLSFCVTSKKKSKNKIFPPNKKFATNTRDRGGSASTNTLLLVVGRSHLYTLLGDSFLYRRAALPSFYNSRFPHFTHSSFVFFSLCFSASRTVRRRRGGSMTDWTGDAQQLSSICFGKSSKWALIEYLRSGTNRQAVGSSLKILIPAGSKHCALDASRITENIHTGSIARHGVRANYSELTLCKCYLSTNAELLAVFSSLKALY